MTSNPELAALMERVMNELTERFRHVGGVTLIVTPSGYRETLALNSVIASNIKEELVIEILREFAKGDDQGTIVTENLDGASGKLQ